MLHTSIAEELICLFRTFNFSDDSINTIMLTIYGTDKGTCECIETFLRQGLFLAESPNHGFVLCARSSPLQIQFWDPHDNSERSTPARSEEHLFRRKVSVDLDF